MSLKDFEKVTFKQYAVLKDKSGFEPLIKFLKPSPILYLKKKRYEPKYCPLINMPFKLYVHLNKPVSDKKLLTPQTQGTINFNVPFICFPEFYDIEQKQLADVKFLNIIAIQKWIKNELDDITKAEKNTFRNRDPKFIMAGGDKLKQFGHYNLINFVSNSDILKEDAIMELSYRRILLYANYKNTQAEIENKMMEMQSKKK